MARVRLTYILGKTENFEALDIDVTQCRKSMDGTKVIVHNELLTDTQMNNIFLDMLGGYDGYMRLSDANVEEMMLTEEWADQSIKVVEEELIEEV